MKNVCFNVQYLSGNGGDWITLASCKNEQRAVREAARYADNIGCYEIRVVEVHTRVVKKITPPKKEGWQVHPNPTHVKD